MSSPRFLPMHSLIRSCEAGGWNITNLGAVMFAKRLGHMGVAGTIHGDVLALVTAAAAEVGGEVEIFGQEAGLGLL